MMKGRSLDPRPAAGPLNLRSQSSPVVELVSVEVSLAVAQTEESATPLLAQNLILQPTLVISQLYDHAFKPGDICIRLIT